MDQDDTSAEFPSSSDDNDIYNDLLEALAPISELEGSVAASASPTVCDGNIYSSGEIHFEPYPYLDPPSPELQLQISLQAGRLDSDPAYSCFILYKNNFFSVLVSTTALNPSLPNPNTLGCVLFGVVNEFEENVEPERVDILMSGPSRKALDAVPVTAQPILANGQTILFQRLRFSRASANASVAKKRKRSDGSADNSGLSIAFRIVVVILDINSGHVYRAAMSSPILVRGQNPSRYAGNSTRQVVATLTPTTSTSEVSSPSQSHVAASNSWHSEPDGSSTTLNKVGIGFQNRAPLEQLEVQGNAVVHGAIYTPSDERIKQNLVPLETETMLKNVSNVKLYEYEYKAQPGRKVRGVIAQEVLTSIPHSVSEVQLTSDDDGDSPSSLLVVNDRALMIENLGATQRLASLFKALSARTRVIGAIAVAALVVSIVVASVLAVPRKVTSTDASEVLIGEWTGTRFSGPKSSILWISVALSRREILLRLPEIGEWGGTISAATSSGDFEGSLVLTNQSASPDTIHMTWVMDPCENGLKITSNDATKYQLYRASPMVSPDIPELYTISTLFICSAYLKGISLSKRTFESGLSDLILSNASAGAIELIPATRNCFDATMVSEVSDATVTTISAQHLMSPGIKFSRGLVGGVSEKKTYAFLVSRTDGLRALLAATILNLHPNGVAKVQVAALQYEWTTVSRNTEEKCSYMAQMG